MSGDFRVTSAIGCNCTHENNSKDRLDDNGKSGTFPT